MSAQDNQRIQVAGIQEPGFQLKHWTPSLVVICAVAAVAYWTSHHPRPVPARLPLATWEQFKTKMPAAEIENFHKVAQQPLAQGVTADAAIIKQDSGQVTVGVATNFPPRTKILVFIGRGEIPKPDTYVFSATVSTDQLVVAGPIPQNLLAGKGKVSVLIVERVTKQPPDIQKTIEGIKPEWGEVFAGRPKPYRLYFKKEITL